jgi:hypothetical protein
MRMGFVDPAARGKPDHAFSPANVAQIARSRRDVRAFADL